MGSSCLREVVTCMRELTVVLRDLRLHHFLESQKMLFIKFMD